MKVVCSMLLIVINIFLHCEGVEAPISEKEAGSIGVEAYIYGYPLVTMEMTRRKSTNVIEPNGALGAPMNQLTNLREYPNAQFRTVTAPNADTLYTSGWLDVSKEPYILSIPDMNGRYFLFPMLSGWTDVFEVPGKRTTGTKAQQYAITGPNWHGILPAGVMEYKSPTALVWILGRTYCTGTPEDYKAVHALQDKYTLVPLSAFEKPYVPPKGIVDPSIDMKSAPRDQVNSMDATAYFKLLAELMKNNPPSKADAPLLKKMAKIGLIPGQDFDIAKLDPMITRGLQNVPKIALKTIEDYFDKAGTSVNGWTVFTKTGIYGTEYLNRAFITMFGLGANRPEDAVYPASRVDSEGKPYNGANKYVMHFNKDELPPVNGFWSLTMYNTEMFFVENQLNRYTVSQRNDLKLNSDGSVDLYIQYENPGKDKESNWLPAPKDGFVLMLRMYWPKETDPSILNGTWQPPAVRLVK